jgi:hypothetical protein
VLQQQHRLEVGGVLRPLLDVARQTGRHDVARGVIAAPRKRNDVIHRDHLWFASAIGTSITVAPLNGKPLVDRQVADDSALDPSDALHLVEGSSDPILSLPLCPPKIRFFAGPLRALLVGFAIPCSLLVRMGLFVSGRSWVIAHAKARLAASEQTIGGLQHPIERRGGLDSFAHYARLLNDEVTSLLCLVPLTWLARLLESVSITSLLEVFGLRAGDAAENAGLHGVIIPREVQN